MYYTYLRHVIKTSFISLLSAREFITRALLASKANLVEILDVLTNKGVGTADGFNVNFAFLNAPEKSRVFHTAEVTPKSDDAKSEVYLADFATGNNSLHTNRYVSKLLAKSYYFLIRN